MATRCLHDRTDDTPIMRGTVLRRVCRDCGARRLVTTDRTTTADRDRITEERSHRWTPVHPHVMDAGYFDCVPD